MDQAHDRRHIYDDDPAISLTSTVRPCPRPCTRLLVVLVRPSRYDDDGYVVRHWRGTLPSNTLSCLNGLTQDAIASGALGPIAVDIEAFDEAVDLVDPRRLAKRWRPRGSTVLVALVGVQTNQFPRAQDLARQFKAEGVEVMIGGFHVSGSIALAPAMPPECQAMIDAGVTLVAGEVENRWAGLLQDAAGDRLQPFYNFLGDVPDLRATPLPRSSPRLQKKFAVRGYGTIDAGRGCPFNCSFCTIVNVQGHAMRSRGASHIVDHIRSAHRPDGRTRGISHYFFTDDNFSRNPEWEPIFNGLIALRHEGVAIDFMMQVDTAAGRIPRFIDKAARAGCVQVFIGMESLREDNLKAAGKRQNRVNTYRDYIAQWHEAGVLCHVGFIIGFPFDTYQRVMEDVRTLRDDLLVDQASFFMLTPLPGSRDHRTMIDAGVQLDSDYNRFDSFHATVPHPLMSAHEWTAAYRDAWHEFYSVEHIRQALLRQNPHTYWGMFKCFVWYRAAMIEGAHPMVTGFFRLKDRRTRRPGVPLESWLRFRRRRLCETLRICREYVRLLLQMQELWVATRIRREDYALLGDLRALKTRAALMLDVKTGWARVHAVMTTHLKRAGDAQGTSSGATSAALTARLAALRRALGTRADAVGRAAEATSDDVRLAELPPLRPGSFLRGLATRLVEPPTPESRRTLTAYWTKVRLHLRRRQFWRLNPVSVAWNAARDLKNAIIFVVAMTSERH
jgi:hypothetical protein